jgi:hypothetical protein
MNKPCLVTFTGADDRTSLNALHEFAEAHPLTEFAVLYSPGRIGSPRYPTKSWLEQFAQSGVPQRALHICGNGLDELLEGDSWISQLVVMFDRVQINFNAQRRADFTPLVASRVANQFFGKRPLLITQHNKNNADFTLQVKSPGHQVLFDTSGGMGRSPEAWPAYLPGKKCGYAGGLGPDNIREELVRISEAAAGNPFWIDMEGKLRDENDNFCLARCGEVIAVVEGA